MVSNIDFSTKALLSLRPVILGHVTKPVESLAKAFEPVRPAVDLSDIDDL